MRRASSKGLYHLALIIVAGTAFNWSFLMLTNVNVINRLFDGVTIPPIIVAIVVCISAIVVLWHNWAD